MRLLTLGLVLSLAGCASTAVRPGTGQLTLRLTWTGLADLDLYAESPGRERVDFLHREAESGGLLDVDCNVGEFSCDQPMENIYWPRGTAPPGRYKYWVVIANPQGAKPSDSYRMRVLVRGEVVREHTGSLTDLHDQQPLTGWILID